MSENITELDRFVCRTNAQDLGWIYFATSDKFTLIKVGFATDLKYRLHSLNTSSPFDLYYREAFRGLKEDERWIQRFLAPHCYNREWFRYTPAVEDFHETLWECRWTLAAKLEAQGFNFPTFRDVEKIPIGPILLADNFEAIHE